MTYESNALADELGARLADAEAALTAHYRGDRGFPASWARVRCRRRRGARRAGGRRPGCADGSREAAGTEIMDITSAFGAESVEGNSESYLAAVGVMKIATRYDGPYDAVAQAGFGEHGREGRQYNYPKGVNPMEKAVDS
jgi:hypothetical protein